jgi:hypothetical protein
MISQTADRRVQASQRQVMQYLRSCDWKIVAKLPVAATAGTLRQKQKWRSIHATSAWPR